MSPKKRRIRPRTILLAAVAVYAIWLGGQVVGYKRYTSGPVEAEVFASPPRLHEIRGSYHIHSKFSDGRKTVDEIAAVAKRSKLDFIILTDHGSPNRRSFAAQGWKNGLLVLAGTEMSSSRGHLVALAFDLPPGWFSRDSEKAAREVRSHGGFTVIAHPYSKTRWSWGGEAVYDGIEIMDTDSMLRQNWRRAVPLLPLFLLKPEVVFLKTIRRPDEQIRTWDRMAESQKTLGFFSVDAHMLYGPAFHLFQIFALLDGPLEKEFDSARSQVFEALRSGRFFSAVDAAADPSGFRFWFDGSELRVQTPFSFAHETRIIHDGRATAASLERYLAYTPGEPGAYRVEVYLRERSPLRADIPWIVSNLIVVPAGGKDNR
jgi:hypothetical protein